MGCVKVLAVVLRVRMKVLRTQSDKEDGRRIQWENGLLSI